LIDLTDFHKGQWLFTKTYKPNIPSAIYIK